MSETGGRSCVKESPGLWCPLSPLSSSLCLWLWKGNKLARRLGKGWAENPLPHVYFTVSVFES